MSYDVVLMPTITLEDLASFPPAAPTLQSQPQGFAVVGLPFNLVGSAQEHSLTGELFDMPVTVRFTPVGYRFDHGDGTYGASPTGGVSWESARLPQFSPTATSHVYHERGRVTPSVSVEYSASVSFGNGWRPVPGVVTANAVGETVEILEARTALVEHTCLEMPTAAGC